MGLDVYWPALLVLVAPILVVAIYAYRTDAAQTPLRPLIQLPDAWVPLSADFRLVLADGRSAVGKYYRAMDGSTRWEVGKAPEEPDTITINNFTKFTSFRYARKLGGWAAVSIQPPPNPTRLRLAPDQEFPAAQKFEGYDVAVTRRAGMEVQEIPALNLLRVRRSEASCQLADDSCGEYLFNIQVGPQPANLFEPPDGVEVRDGQASAGVTRPAHGERLPSERSRR